MSEIFEIADEITVLRDGQHVITSPVDEIDEDKVIMSMVGRILATYLPEKIKDWPAGLRSEKPFQKESL